MSTLPFPPLRRPLAALPFRTVLAAALVAALAACDGAAAGGAGEPDAAADTVTVEMRNLAFRAPDGTDSLAVTAGQTIRFVNRDAAPHTATSTSSPKGAGFDSGRLDRDGVFHWTPGQAGRWVYRCDFHPTQMQGAVITVEPGPGAADGAAGPEGDGGDPGARPAGGGDGEGDPGRAPGPDAQAEGAPSGDAAAGQPGAGAADTAASAATADTVTVEVGDFFFRGPGGSSRLSLRPGQTVRFVNRGEADHTVTSTAAPTGAGFDSGDLEPGRSFHWTPDSPGQWSYVCDFHDEMSGTIRVGDGGGPAADGPAPGPEPAAPGDAGAGAAVVVEITDGGFSRPDVTVEAGQRVTWINRSSRVHSVSARDGPDGGGEFDSEELRPGETFTFVPTVSGTWIYECDEHSDEPHARLRVR